MFKNMMVRCFFVKKMLNEPNFRKLIKSDREVAFFPLNKPLNREGDFFHGYGAALIGPLGAKNFSVFAFTDRLRFESKNLR